MTCAEVRRHLSAYIDEELDDATRDAVSGHLEQCEQCRQQLVALTKTVKMIRSLGEVPWGRPREGDDRKSGSRTR
jgi:anti-sigma factor RsiW